MSGIFLLRYGVPVVALTVIVIIFIVLILCHVKKK
jgi:hypothetical protein